MIFRSAAINNTTIEQFSLSLFLSILYLLHKSTNPKKKKESCSTQDIPFFITNCLTRLNCNSKSCNSNLKIRQWRISGQSNEELFAWNPSIIISYGSWAAKHVLLCAWRKSETGCRGLNSPLAPACFQHFGQLPVACKRSAISPLSNLVLAAYHRSDDQITWPPLVTSRSLNQVTR